MKPIEYQPNQIRVFLGILLTVAVFFTWRATRGSTLRLPLLVAEILLVAIFMIWPRPFFPVFRAIMTVTAHLGHLIFTVISAIVFFVLLTPLALTMRLFGKVFMTASTDSQLTTYFEPGQDNLGHPRQF